VKDLDRSSRWYQEILGLEPRRKDEWWTDRGRFFGNGEVLIALFQHSPGETYSSKGMPGFNHQAFRVSAEDYDQYKTFLREKKVSFSEMDHKISWSIYFQDPDDYWVEITTYEKSRG